VRFLFDVNLLIAILDPDHLHHDVALSWFDRTGHEAWATSPLVQNGVIRILGAAGYAAMPFGCGEIADLLAEWCAVPEHEFWPDDVSLCDGRLVDRRRLTSPGRISDSYLLALAASKGGQLATLDRRLSPLPVYGGEDALHVIGGER
jgi:toxin-antitoxin system PIN domain toxin